MPWVLQSYVRIVGARRIPATRRVWVEPSGAKAPVINNDRDEQRAAKAAADKAKAAVAAKSLARRRLWESLHKRSNDVRNSIAPPTQGTSISPARIAKLTNDPVERAAIIDKAKAAELVKQRYAAGQAQYKAYADFQKIQQRKAADRAALDVAKKNIGTKAAGTTLERLVTQARARQKASGNTDFDQAFVDELGKAYRDHAVKVQLAYKRKVDLLLTYYKTDKNGKLVGYTSESAKRAAKEMLKDLSFRQLQNEYVRLDGDGQKNKGTITTVFSPNFEGLSNSQRDYTLATAKTEYMNAEADVQRRIHKLLSHGEEAAARELRKEWENGGKLAYDFAITEIDPTKTSVKSYVPGPGGPGSGFVPVYRTVEEEFQFRRTQYVAEMKRRAQEWAAKQASIQRAQRMDANNPDNRQMAIDANQLAAASKSLGLGDKGPVSREEQKSVVDAATKQWADAHRDEILTPRTKQMLAGGGRGAVWAQGQKDYKAYEKAVLATRDRYYGIFRTEAPGILENVIGLPVVKPITQTLSGLGGLPGTLIRWNNLAGGNLFTGAFTGYNNVGDNTSKIGGAEPNPADVPPAVKVMLDDAEKNGGMRFGGVARRKAYEAWLKTPDGLKWFTEQRMAGHKKSYEEDRAFMEGLSNNDIWTKLDAISTYGFGITNNDMANLIASFALDPTNAIPLKATTWLARVEHAIDATKTVTGVAGLKRLTLAAGEWMTVTEPELRFEKAIKPYLHLMEAGVRPETIREMVLSKLAGIPDGPSRAKDTEKLFRDLGINPRSASGHEIMSFAEEAVASKFKAIGVDYHDMARQAIDLEAKKVADEAAAHAVRDAAMKAADAAAMRAAKTAEAAARKGTDAAAAERAAERLAIETRIARPPLARVVDDVAAAVVPTRASIATDVTHTSTTVGHTAPVILAMQVDDPIRRAVADGARITNRTEITRTQSILNAIVNDGHEVVQHHGVDFAPGSYTDAFLASDKAKRWIADLEAMKPGRDGGAIPNLEVRRIAQDGLYEAGRRSMAKRLQVREGLFTGAGEAIPLKAGQIPWDTERAKSFHVRGGPKSFQQYIAKARDLAYRGGARNPSEEMLITAERSVFEGMKKRAFSLKKALTKGKITQEQFDADIITAVREMGVNRISTNLSQDISSNAGGTIHGVLDDILDSVSPLIPTGEILYQDLMSAGHLDHYYETFSLIPGMMDGVGYRTALMDKILNPEWRAALTRGQFNKMLKRAMFYNLDPVTPMKFRETGAHLFALFHLTLLDGDFARLEAYSKSIEALLAEQPDNIFGRMWKVMETRADLDWADGFIQSEDAFVHYAMLGKTLHPNLALAMIPYGPIARILPTSHGFLNHLSALATTLNPLFKMSPAKWVDDSVTVALTKIVNAPDKINDGITLASQVIHYIATNYGDVTRRAHFLGISQDFSIEAAWRKHGLASYPIQELRLRYFAYRRATARLEPDEHALAEWSQSFENMFRDGKLRERPLQNVNINPLRRRTFPELHDAFEELYWGHYEGGGGRSHWVGPQITHDNPGLHTMKFFEMMQHPKYQRGDDWVRFAQSYFDHMVGAGAEEEARVVLKTVFEHEIARSTSMMYEGLTDLGKSVDASFGGVRRGAVVDFLTRAKLISKADVERAIAEGRARVRVEKSFAETEVQDAAMRDEFLLADSADPALRARETLHLYDNADLSSVTERVGHFVEVLRNVTKETQDLADGGVTAPKVAVDAAAKEYRRILRKSGYAAASAFLKKLPEAQQAHALVKVRREIAMLELTTAMNRIVRDLLHMDAIPTDVGKQIEEVVAHFKDFPEGQAWVNEWAKTFRNDLFASHLIHFFEHKEWFDVRAVEQAATSDIVVLERQITQARNKVVGFAQSLRDGVRGKGAEEHAIDAEERASLTARMDVASAELDRITAERDAAVAKRDGLTGVDGSIERKMAEGDVAGSQADNVAAASGGTPESGGAVRAEPPIAPTMEELHSPRVSVSQRALELLNAMSEEEWLHRELIRARRARDMAIDRNVRNAAIKRAQNAEKALKVIEVMKSGGKKSFIPPKAKATFQSTIRSVVGARAIAIFSPKSISPFLPNAAAARTEQARSLYRLWRNAPVDSSLSNARVPGEVSAVYKAHGPAMEAYMDTPIKGSWLRQFGFPEHLLDDITLGDLLLGVDEMKSALRIRKFSDMMSAIAVKAELELRSIAGAGSDYGIERWLDDRLVHRSDFYDALDYEKHDRIVEAAIIDAREGAVRQLSVDARQRPGTHGEDPLMELVETDIRAVVGKTKALRSLGVDVHAYNEARKVLRTPMNRMRRGQAIAAEAAKRATDVLYKAGKTVDSKDWDKLYKKERDKAFIEVRQEMSDKEALRQLEFLAGGEMLGSKAEDIITEFEKRWGLDQNVKDFEPGPITPYQKLTLENAIKTHMGITDINDPAQIIEGLGRHGTRPPFDNRAAMREWLTEYGFWSPRTAQAIEAGKKSWRLEDEYKYYVDNWGFAPDWANPELIKPVGALNRMIHDEKFFGEMNRQWGLFNRNFEARIKTKGWTRERMARALAEGDPGLGLNPKRDLPMERRYVMERYGDIAADNIVYGPDGRVISGDLKAFPWLMHKDEYAAYMIARTKAGLPIAEDLVQSSAELDVLHALIDKHMGKYVNAAMAGKTMTYADLLTVASNITHDLLSDPVWLKRNIDYLGKGIRIQAALRRSLVFTQLGFMTTNVIDTAIKGPWTKFITRSFHNGPASERAMELTLEHFGLEFGGQFLRDVPLHGTSRIRGSESLLRQLQGVTELPAQGAGMAEDFTKLRLAQGMFDGAYERALKKVGDPDLADVIAREFVGKEVSRLWPTVGDGPIERLFNSLSPFLSYQFKNHVIFIGEFIGHPSLYNSFRHIGDVIERYNYDHWYDTHDESEPPDPKLMRLIELPWAPGMFIDLGQFSDAQRGLKPLYQALDGKVQLEQMAANFVRLVGPNDQNIVSGILNSFNLAQRKEWKQIIDADGFPTGRWEQVSAPWEAPWGGAANLWNSLWFVEDGAALLKAMENKWNVTDTTQFFYKTFFFGGLKQYDQGAGLSNFFFALKKSDPAAAEAWLLTADGKNLQAWWADRAGATKDWFTPKEIKDILNPPSVDSQAWLHSQTPEIQTKIKQGFEDLKNMRAAWDVRIDSFTPGTAEYANAKLERSTQRYQYYVEHPWMIDYQFGSMTPAEWAKQLDDWTVDDLVQSFFDIGVAPKRIDFKSAVDWQAAVLLWKQKRANYLKSFPQVAERLGQSRDSVEAVWKATEQDWFDTLDRVGTRSIAIEAAKQAKDYDLLDQLYLANELDYSKLGADEMVFYFDDSDYKALTAFDKERGRSPQVKTDPSGQPFLTRLKVLPDFNQWRFDRMSVGEKQKFARDQKYGLGMKDIIAKAKASDNFGATFVNELKKHPDLLGEYFRRNPGKREKWATNDAYIKAISKYGLLAKAGKFTEAGRYFDNLPDWVKARYYSKHPEKRQKLQENLQYMNFMEKWTSFYKHRDYMGGANFFEKMPQWVKDRYFAKNPNGFGKGGGGTSPYAKAMGKWVKLLQDGDKDGAKTYFDSLPQAFKDRYYAKHPDAKLRSDIKRVGQLGQYFAADDANRAQYLIDNPLFAKWLKAQGSKSSTRRMMILAAYQGLPQEDQWLRRVFREKYPEVFSKQAAGDASIRKVASFLVEHPDMTPAFEKWMKAVLASYAEELKHEKAPPKPILSDHTRQRGHGVTRWTGSHTGHSAAWVRLHSIG